MARKSNIARDKKRHELVKKYSKKRTKLLSGFKTATTISEKFKIHTQLQKLPRNSSRTRIHNR